MENTDKGRHLAAELREWVYQTKGWFSLRDVYRDLNVLSKEGQTAVRMALTRMTQAEPPVLEHHPTRNGDYRLIDTAMNVVSFLRTEDVVPYDVKLPFRLDEFCLTLKKNIIVIAGSPNSGKGHPDGTPILTDNGFRLIEQLAVGDYVMGANGKRTKVAGIYPRGEAPDGVSIQDDMLSNGMLVENTKLGY